MRTRFLVLGLLVVLAWGLSDCKQPDATEPNLPPLPFTIKVTLSANSNDVVLSWARAKDPNGDPVTYSVVYNDTLINNLTDTTYTFQKGSYDISVTGSVIARDNNGASTSVQFKGSVDSKASYLETIRFVKPDDGRTLKNGLSWATAYDQTQLQTAINSLSVTGGQVWVAQGVYKPTTDVTNRLASFSMRNRVAIYGGFSADTTAVSSRNPNHFPTILSGDIDGDGTLANNSYSVIINNPGSVLLSYYNLDSTAVLDGFIITGGNGTGNAGGGGIRNLTNYPTNNTAGPTIGNCQIIGNAASYGGGVSNSFSYNLRFINCLIADNYSVGPGGGMYSYSSNPRLINCVVRNNSAGSGGGLYNMTASSPKLVNCTLTGNSAPPGEGGALYSSYYSGPSLYNCIMWDNGGQNAIVTNRTPGQSYYDVSADHSLIEAEETNYIACYLCGNNLKLTSSPFVLATSQVLRQGSPAIDGGDNGFYRQWGGAPNDFTGNSRIINQVIDIGAIEYR